MPTSTLPLAERPNVLLIIGEDTGLHLGCYGDMDARTPILDQLARDGMRVNKAFTHTPVCAPSRSGFVTGCYPYSIGSHQMRSTLINPPEMFTRRLKDAGWHVSWPSKTDFNFAMQDRDITDKRDWQKEGLLQKGPWFAYTNLGITHESCMWPDKDEARDQRDQYVRPEERIDPTSITVPPFLPDTPAVRADITRHHENAMVLDRQVGDILRDLEATGQADNTIVIFMVDHGAGIPRGKRWCYDLGVRMPLMVRWPKNIPAQTVHGGLVGWVDVGPQILAWCGLEAPEHMQGRVFHGPQATTAPREFCFGGRDRMDEQFDRIRFARSQRFMYIRNFHPELPWAQRNKYMETMPSMGDWRQGHVDGTLDPVQKLWFSRTKPVEEIYDTIADPWNVRNLAVDPAYAAELVRHRQALDAHLAKVGDLGAVNEWELIKKGLVVDRLTEEYSSRIEPLPAPYDNLGGPWTVEGKPWALAQASSDVGNG